MTPDGRCHTGCHDEEERSARGHERPSEAVGHHDLGPWNFLFDGVEVVGIIDWDEPPDRAARLRWFADTYGHGVEPAELLDLAAVRLASIAADIEHEVRSGNPAFDVQRDERHADAYREDLEFILRNRESLLRTAC